MYPGATFFEQNHLNKVIAWGLSAQLIGCGQKTDSSKEERE